MIANKNEYNRLKELNDEVKKLPMPILKEVDLEDQLIAYHNGLDALEIIEEMIYENGY